VSSPGHAQRDTYLRVIERERAAGVRRGVAEDPQAAQPPRASVSYARRRELDRLLADHYERCRRSPRTRARFGDGTRRQKEYCAAVAWKIARSSGRFPDYPAFRRSPSPRTKETVTMRRDSRGRFLKKSGSPRAGKRRNKRSGTHHVKGYTMHRRGKTVRVAPHTSHEAAAPTRRRRRRSGGRRRSSSRRGGARPVIVVANSPRRRSGHRRHVARMPPVFSLTGMLAFGVGGMIGGELADVTDRYIAGYMPPAQGQQAPQLPSSVAPGTTIAQYNDAVQAAPPNGMRILGQIGVSLAGFAFGAVSQRFGHGILALFGYGWGFGGLFHLGTQVIDSYLIAPMFVSNNALTARGSQLYQHEYNAKQIVSPAAQTTSTSTTTTTSTTTPTGTSQTPQVGASTQQPPAGTSAGSQQQQQPSTTGAPQRSAQGTPVAAAARPMAGLPAGHAGHRPTALATVGQPTTMDLFPTVNAKLGEKIVGLQGGGGQTIMTPGGPSTQVPTGGGGTAPPVMNGGGPAPGGGGTAPPSYVMGGHGGVTSSSFGARDCCDACRAGNVPACTCASRGMAGDPPAPERRSSPMLTSLLFGHAGALRARPAALVPMRRVA
jgi:hypothetical protein